MSPQNTHPMFVSVLKEHLLLFERFIHRKCFHYQIPCQESFYRISGFAVIAILLRIALLFDMVVSVMLVYIFHSTNFHFVLINPKTGQESLKQKNVYPQKRTH